MRLFLLILLLFSNDLFAQKTIEITSMYAPGGAADVISRQLESAMGIESYRVMHRTGGLGQIAIKKILTEDALMVVLGPQIFVINPMINHNLNYVPEKDLEVVEVFAIMPSVLVCNQKSNLKNIIDLLEATKPLSFGTSGYGSNEFLVTELLNTKTKTKHKILAYPHGGATAVPDLLGGHIDCMFANYPTIKNHLSNDTLNILLTSHDLSLTDNTWIKVFSEEFPINAYVAVIVAKNKSDIFKNQIANDVANALKIHNFNSKLQDLGFIPTYGKVDRTDYFSNNRRIKSFIINNQIKLTR